MTRRQGDRETRRIAERFAGKKFGVHICLHRCTHERMLAFTLTELLTVIAIIAILMGLLFTFYRPSQEQRKVFECQNRLQVIHRALRLYMLDWDGFPASPYDSLDNDKDGRFDEDPVDGIDNDGDGRVDEDQPDAPSDNLFDPTFLGLGAIREYVRSQRVLICPSDQNQFSSQGVPPSYSSYQGCDTGTGFIPPTLPYTGSQQTLCLQSGGVPTYAITRFLPGDDCHPSGLDDDNDGRSDEDPINGNDDDMDGKVDEDPPNILTLCHDPDKMRQLAVLNTKPYFPLPTFPDDNTVVTWCVHHRYMPNTTTPNYTKGGTPADVVLCFDGSVRIQAMRTPNENWRRKPTEQ
ncbi:MAG: type II secretion system protein [Armatimonadota bacterium]